MSACSSDWSQKIPRQLGEKRRSGAKSSALFSRLRIWAAGRSDLLGPLDAAEVLLGLDDDAFWNAYGQRDLLLVLSRRWGGLPDRQRRRLERRLLRGPPRRNGKSLVGSFVKERRIPFSAVSFGSVSRDARSPSTLTSTSPIFA